MPAVPALGEFVEGLNAEDLNVSVFKGQVELSNLQIKTTAFDGLGCAAARASRRAALLPNTRRRCHTAATTTRLMRG